MKKAADNFKKAIRLTCEQSEKAGGKYYKFVSLNKNRLDLLIRNRVRFSSLDSLNDPLECPVLRGDAPIAKFCRANEDYTPRILSLVRSNDKVEHGIDKAAKSTADVCPLRR